MRVSDILRQMADVVDQVEGGEQVQQLEPAIEPTQSSAPVVQEPEPEAQAPAITGQLDAPEEPQCAADDDELTMVSPLQQEHELLKKSQGVNNSVSEFAGDEDSYQNELAAMKQTAGIGEEQASAKAKEEQQRMEAQLNPRANAAIAFNKARSDRSS